MKTFFHHETEQNEQTIFGQCKPIFTIPEISKFLGEVATIIIRRYCISLYNISEHVLHFCSHKLNDYELSNRLEGRTINGRKVESTILKDR